MKMIPSAEEMRKQANNNRTQIIEAYKDKYRENIINKIYEAVLRGDLTTEEPVDNHGSDPLFDAAMKELKREFALKDYSFDIKYFNGGSMSRIVISWEERKNYHDY